VADQTEPTEEELEERPVTGDVADQTEPTEEELEERPVTGDVEAPADEPVSCVDEVGSRRSF